MDVRRLDTLLGEHAPDVERLDLVSVDVEGWELGVLDNLSFERYRPTLVIVENLFTETAYRDAMDAATCCGGMSGRMAWGSLYPLADTRSRTRSKRSSSGESAAARATNESKRVPGPSSSRIDSAAQQ